MEKVTTIVMTTHTAKERAVKEVRAVREVRVEKEARVEKEKDTFSTATETKSTFNE